MDFCVKKIFCAKLLQQVNSPEQMLPRLGAKLTELTPDGTAIGILSVGDENLNPWGTVHGGALATLADTVAGSAVVAATQSVCVTVNYSLNFLRSADQKNIRCEARPERLGRHICVIRVDMTDDEGKAIAVGEFTFCVMKPIKVDR